MQNYRIAYILFRYYCTCMKNIKELKWSMNKTEVQALRTLQGKKMSVSELAMNLSKSLSWTSECVNHLKYLGFLEKERKKEYNNVFVSISRTPLGESLSVLKSEEPMLNLEAIFAGSGLKLMPLLLKPGYSARALVARTSLSVRTVKGVLPRWRKMGVVLLDNGIYYVNPRYKLLSDFLRKFSEHKNICFLNEKNPEAVIVWQWRDEFMFSMDHQITDSDFLPAGLSRLDSLTSNLLHTQEYYCYDVGKGQVSEEEALVQALYSDRNNPRIARNLKTQISNVDQEILLKYAGKYGLKRIIKELVGLNG